MTIEAGDKLAHYEIVEPIGKGGMGVVYRAKDSKLGRDVAIKVLPDELARDEERLRRFQREAKVLASLNHPNIASIYGLEQSGETHYLVLELVPGETLAERIARGPIPVDEALRIAIEIAGALDEAHERGIIHRDLKPANIKLTEDGKVKVLDFGLAKALVDNETEGDAATSMSPTLTRDATRIGVILGTAAYMSPEQAKGKRVDRRTDVFALGAVIYEMLTRQRAFGGEDVATTLARVIEREPDWSALPANVTPVLATFLRRCLAKDRKQRVHDVADLRLALEGAFDVATAGERTAKAGGRAPWFATFGAGVVTSLIAMAIYVGFSGGATGSSSAHRRLSIALPESHELTGVAESFASPLAMAPDGSHVVYSVVDGARTKLYRRDLDSFEARAIPGTEDASSPFFSPDGAWLGFFSGGSFKKLSVGGGTPIVIARVPTYLGTGVDWGDDGWIRFPLTSLGSGLWQVSADGGDPEPITSVDTDRGEYAHSWPQLLPDQRHVLFTIWGGPGKGVAVLDLDTREWRTIVPGGGGASLLSSGHLVYRRTDAPGQLFAIAFDSTTREIVGSAVPVLAGVQVVGSSDHPSISVSKLGTLAYIPQTANEDSLVRVDRQGERQEFPALEPDAYFNPRLSPDGARLAYAVSNRGIWILNLDTGVRSRHSVDSVVGSPSWSVDASQLFFSSIRNGAWNLYGKPVGKEGRADQLLNDTIGHFPQSWSPDGSVLALEARSPVAGSDIYLWRDGELVPFLATEFDERMPKFSPNGRYIAYVSNQSGRHEIHVADFPNLDMTRPVSTDGGTEPLWSPDGRELFYRHGKQVMVVDVNTAGEFEAGAPRLLFEGDYAKGLYQNWDVAPDGKSFVMVARDSDRPREIRIVEHWYRELERLVPVEN